MQSPQDAREGNSLPSIAQHIAKATKVSCKGHDQQDLCILCSGPCGVVVYHRTTLLVRSQAWPSGLNISLLSNDPCPARSGIKAFGKSGVGGPFLALYCSKIPVLVLGSGSGIELSVWFEVAVRKS